MNCSLDAADYLVEYHKMFVFSKGDEGLKRILFCLAALTFAFCACQTQEWMDYRQFCAALNRADKNLQIESRTLWVQDTPDGRQYSIFLPDPRTPPETRAAAEPLYLLTFIAEPQSECIRRCTLTMEAPQEGEARVRFLDCSALLFAAYARMETQETRALLEKAFSLPEKSPRSFTEGRWRYGLAENEAGLMFFLENTRLNPDVQVEWTLREASR